MNKPAWESLHERSLHDLLAAERQVRASLENEYRKLMTLLESLARQHYGAALEDLRRADPQALQGWGVADWENFFRAVPRNLPNRSETILIGKTWGVQPESSPLTGQKGPESGKPATYLENESQRLQAEVNRLQAEIERQQAELLPSKTQELEAQRQTQSSQLPGQISLAEFKMPLIPLKYSALESEFGGLQWRRAMLILYLMANFGINAHVEIDRQIAPVEGLSYRSNSTKKPVKKLIQMNLVIGETLKIERSALEIGFALWVLRLTDQGRELCQALGWQPVESEWERLLRLSQTGRDHHLAVLYLAILGRGRDYQVSILPENTAETQPLDSPSEAGAFRTGADVRLRRGQEDDWVLVTLDPSADTVRSRSLHKVQGQVAICTLNPRAREQIVKDCQQAQTPGKATDLATLKAVRLAETSATDPLWLAAWP